MFTEVINMYGAEIIGTLLLALAGIVAMVVVQFVEQAYKDLHGEEKLSAALATLSELLAEKKIYATETEMKVLIEAAVAEFNEVFRKPIDDEGAAKAAYRGGNTAEKV